MLSKNQIAQELEDRGVAKRNLVKRVLDELAALGLEEVESGEDFSVPGLTKISYRYTASLKKGERHKKGETYTGFGGVEVTAEEDSKPRAEALKIKADPAPAIKRALPKKGSKGYKAVVARKAKK